MPDNIASPVALGASQNAPARAGGTTSAVPHRRLFLWAGPLFAAVLTLWLYLSGGRYVEEGDANVGLPTVMIAPQVSGTLVKRSVSEGQPVRDGDLLFEIDTTGFRIAQQTAKAQWGAAEDQARALQQSYAAKTEIVAQAEAALHYARETFDRIAPLVRNRTATPAQLDQTTRDVRAAEATLAAARADAAAVLAQLGGRPDRPVADLPAVRQAKLAVDAADRNLAFAEVRAPSAGVVTGVDALQIGALLGQSQTAIALVSSTPAWVTANIKETDLTHVQIGNPVTISIDTYPQHVWRGKVTSVGPATAATFAVLPPQNATGNWVKVVQRVPVRIDLEPASGQPVLRTGLSATVSIDTGYRRSLGTLVSDSLHAMGLR